MFREKIPNPPKFFHFNETLVAAEFQAATLITFTKPDGSVIIMKDLYNRMLK